MSDQQWVTLARVVRTQGRKGEVLADLLTDFPERFQTQPDIFLRSPAKGEPRAAVVESSWMPTGRSAGRIVLKLAGVDSISDAELLAGAEVQIPAAERVSLADGTYYVSDLIGCRMTNRGDEIGTVSDMHFPQDTAGRRIEDAAAIFVVERANGDEILIPFASAFVRRIDTASRTIDMELPDGLLQMNG